jgi:hypothetical protein
MGRRKKKEKREKTMLSSARWGKPRQALTKGVAQLHN